MSVPFGAAADAAEIFARPDSVPVGILEHRIWKAFGPTKKEAWRFVDAVIGAAEKYDHDTKMPGDRRGALGLSGIKVLKTLFSLADFTSGRLEPSITAIAAKAKLARGTVWRALDRLKREGFLWWVRRKVETGNEGPGPQIHQATNAYWFKLRGRAAGLVRLWLGRHKPPIPGDAVSQGEQDREAVDTMLARATSEDAARFLAGDSVLGDSLASLGRAVDSNASSIKGRNPDT